ncbi:MAG: T9SS type A sorting domain-containing protein [Bacteroidia bacterium]
MRILLAALAFIATINLSFAQCLIQNIPLNKRVNDSKIIVEAEVISKTSFEDEATGRIYTANELKIYSTLKGETSPSLTLFTFGGQVGDRLETASPSLQLEVGQVGVFLVDQKMEFNNSIDGYFGVTGPSSFIQYNKLNRRAIDAFETFANANELKNDINDITGNTGTISTIPNIYYSISANKKAGITSFTDTVYAGNGTVLTINGTGFGTAQGTVGFANGNDGGSTNIEVSDDHYFVSWSNTKIEVYVPQLAGTGKFYVKDANNQTYTSSSDLVITYARLSVTSNGPSTNPGTRLYYPVLDDDNGDGGYTWRFHQDFFKEKGAVKSILRALQSWRCSTKANFNVDTVTAVSNNKVDRDGVHTIMWQNPNQSISTGALAVTFSMWSGCYNASIKDWHWYLNDVDMVFDDELSNNRTWNYGPGDASTSEYDMESVALHEFGHAHQLAHIIDVNGVMHYSIRNGEEKRTLNTNVDVAAGENVMKASTVSTGCSGVDPMKPVTSNCQLIDVVDVNAEFTVNATKYCVGDTVIVTDNSGPAGSTYSWRIPNQLSDPIDLNGATGYIVLAAGDVSIGLLVENSGFSDSLYVGFLCAALPKPLSKADDVICAGDGNGEARVILGEGIPPFEITWQDNNSNANPRKNLEPGLYYFTCRDASGCSANDSVEISSPDSLLVFESGTEPTWGGLARGVAFVSAKGGVEPYKYRWDDEDNTKGETLSGVAAGDYKVTITDANDCTVEQTLTVEELPSSLDEVLIADFVYPNPASDVLIINNENNFNKIEIYNTKAQLVLQKELTIGSSTINTAALNSGIYLVKLIGEKETIIGQLSVQN